jgi:hypothetical protein
MGKEKGEEGQEKEKKGREREKRVGEREGVKKGQRREGGKWEGEGSRGWETGWYRTKEKVNEEENGKR